MSQKKTIKNFVNSLPNFVIHIVINYNLTSFVNLKNLDTALYTDKIIRLIKLNAKLMHAVLQLT